MPEARLHSARLAAVANAGFVPTSQKIQERLPNLFSLPTKGRFTVLDLTCGRGDFLAPFDNPRADLYGVEISEVRANEARSRFPHAFIVHAPYEETAVSRGKVSVGLANFPYFYQERERTETIGIVTMTPMLCTDGVLFVLLPVRSAWENALINHLVKYYCDIRVYRSPGEAFSLYTQLLIVAVKRGKSLKTIDEALPEKRRLEQWIYRETDEEGRSPWRGGTPPPELPTTPLDNPYHIPIANQPVQIRVMRPEPDLLLQYLSRSGVHTTPAWQAATFWSPGVKLEQPLVPIEGEAHIAACTMLDMFACEEFQGPDGKRYTFLAYLDKDWVEVEPDVEEQKEGVIRIVQEQDRLQLSVLNITDSKLSHYRNDEVHEFLAPWLPLMKQIINERYPALYQGKPERWLVEATAITGMDRTLRGSSSPGLVRTQLEKVWAMWYALCEKGHVGLAGEQGVGKTRITISLLMAFAYAWRYTREVFGEKPPRWITNLEEAWAANPLVTTRRPKALPALIECPLNVVESVWMEEIRVAWPEAEVIIVNDYTDIHVWFELCATSHAPAVIAIFPQSKTRATRRRWLPAVLRRKLPVETLNLSEEAVTSGGIPQVSEKGVVQCYLDPHTGDPMYTTMWIERFYCPQCGLLIMGRPLTSKKTEPPAPLNEDDEADASQEDVVVANHQSARAHIHQDRLEPVGSIAYFEYKPRTCQCGSPLWTVARTESVERKHPRLTYAQWLRGMETFMTTITHGREQSRNDCGMPTATILGPELTLWKDKEKRPLVRLAEISGVISGPICLQLPDLALDRSTPIIEYGKHIGYRLPTGDEVTAIYDIQTRQLVGYVSQTTQKVLTKRYGFVAPPADSFSPYAYLEQFFRGLVAFAEIDEGHNARNRDTDIGASTQEAQRAAQTYAYGTGTPYGGVLRSFYYEQARLNFRFWQRLGFGWKDSGKAQSCYGFSRVLTYEREIESEAHRGTGRTVTSNVVQSTPGLAVSLIPFLFSEWIDFLLDHMGAHLPDRVEIPLLIPMEDPDLEARLNEIHIHWRQVYWQEQQAKEHYETLMKAEPPSSEAQQIAAHEAWQQAKLALETASREKRQEETWIQERNLQEAYREAAKSLADLAKTEDAVKLTQNTILRLWTTLPFWKNPRYTVSETLRGEWGDIEGKNILYELPVLAEDYFYPLERVMYETVAKEVKAGRPIAVAFLQNGKRNTAERLQWVLRDFHPWLLSNDIQSMDREHAVKNAVAAGYMVLLMPFQRTREGSNFQFIKNAYWAELSPDDLFASEQWIRRFWRLGQDQEVHIYFPVMIGTAAFYTLYRLGLKSAGLSLFLGKTPNSGLAHLVGAHKTALARLSAAIAQGEEVGDAEMKQVEQLMSEQISAVFAQRNADYHTLTSSQIAEPDDEVQRWIREARQRKFGIPIRPFLTNNARQEQVSSESLVSVEHPWEEWRRREQELRLAQRQKAKEAAKEKARFRRLLIQSSKSTLARPKTRRHKRRTLSLPFALQQSLW